MSEHFWSLISIALCVLLAIAILIGRAAINKRNYLQSYLNSLMKKSHLEQELSLATMEQLMNEIGSRTFCFILLAPDPKKLPDVNMQVFVRGMPQQVASIYLSQASSVVAFNEPFYPQGMQGEKDGEK